MLQITWLLGWSANQLIYVHGSCWLLELQVNAKSTYKVYVGSSQPHMLWFTTCVLEETMQCPAHYVNLS